LPAVGLHVCSPGGAWGASLHALQSTEAEQIVILEVGGERDLGYGAETKKRQKRKSKLSRGFASDKFCELKTFLKNQTQNREKSAFKDGGVRGPRYSSGPAIGRGARHPKLCSARCLKDGQIGRRKEVGYNRAQFSDSLLERNGRGGTLCRELRVEEKW